MAKTSRPCSAANLAVISDPLANVASTTSTQEPALVCKPLSEVPVGGWVNSIEPGPDNRNAAALGAQSPAMRGGIDP